MYTNGKVDGEVIMLILPLLQSFWLSNELDCGPAGKPPIIGLHTLSTACSLLAPYASSLIFLWSMTSASIHNEFLRFNDHRHFMAIDSHQLVPVGCMSLIVAMLAFAASGHVMSSLGGWLVGSIGVM